MLVNNLELSETSSVNIFLLFKIVTFNATSTVRFGRQPIATGGTTKR